MKITDPTVLTLEALARGYHYGFDVMDATGLPSGTIYPILRRFEREGIVTSEWEAEGIARTEQRPPRRYYELTADGHKVLADNAARYRPSGAVVPRDLRELRAVRQS